jgi:hypothetical protein
MADETLKALAAGSAFLSPCLLESLLVMLADRRAVGPRERRGNFLRRILRRLFGELFEQRSETEMRERMARVLVDDLLEELRRFAGMDDGLLETDRARLPGAPFLKVFGSDILRRRRLFAAGVCAKSVLLQRECEIVNACELVTRLVVLRIFRQLYFGIFHDAIHRHGLRHRKCRFRNRGQRDE